MVNKKNYTWEPFTLITLIGDIIDKIPLIAASDRSFSNKISIIVHITDGIMYFC